MRATAPGEAVIDLPWLCPGADALAALARSPVCWPALRDDPGAVLLVVRHSPTFATPSLPFSAAHLLEPSLAEAALRIVRDETGSGFIDWGCPGAHEVRSFARHCACLAEQIAVVSGHCARKPAWIGGLLAPLGWLGVCAGSPQRARDCLTDPKHARHPAETQRRHWGLDQTALARRLARRWSLPPWLAAIVGHLGLPPEDVRRCDGSPELSAVVGLAVRLAQGAENGLGLHVGACQDHLAAALGLSPGTLEELRQQAKQEVPTLPNSPSGLRPSEVPLLGDLLALAVENRRLRDIPALRRLEAETDALADALEEARSGEAERLRSLKLTSLAELAAGAGHEINNPLAVISGQAQVLLNKLRHPRPRVVGTVHVEHCNGNGENGRNGDGENGDGHVSPSPLLPLSPSLAEAEPALRKIIEQTHAHPSDPA